VSANRRTQFLLAWIIAAVCAVGVRQSAADKITVINNYGAGPFVMGGYSYVPLRTVTDFIGAALLWDSLKGRATLTLSGKQIGLVIGSPYAIIGGTQVVLPAAPVIVQGQVFVPSAVFVQHCGVPIFYEPRLRVIRIGHGPAAWGTLKVGRVPSGLRFMRGKPVWAKRETHGRMVIGPGKGPGKWQGKASVKGQEKGRGKGRGEGHGKGHGKGKH
jgi:hypothetical protein